MAMAGCKSCGKEFEITDREREYYKKIDVPEPQLCPACRQQRRLAHANLPNLYKRRCEGSGDEIISSYAPDSPHKVYSQKYWNSDKWDALSYGRDFDFNRPFFEQFEQLYLDVPHPALLTGYEFDENSAYTNHAGKNKNCYMIFDSDENWDCMYGHGILDNKNCIDNYRIKKSELCYECVDCTNSYRLFYSQDCDNCSDSAFLKNCTGCHNCFMCSNLNNKQYYIFNEQKTKEEYESFMRSLANHEKLEEFMKYAENFMLKFPQKSMHGVQNENVTGDYLYNCKNSDNAFECLDLWDGNYMTRVFDSAKDCMDCDEVGGVELLYNSAFVGYGVQNGKCMLKGLTNLSNVEYCIYCFKTSDCFGCVGLQRKKYCILNKQYSQDEYEDLRSRIIDHMKKTGEYGEFFPIEISSYGYNETVAQEYYPLTKEEAVAKDYKWRDPDKKEYMPATAQVPNISRDADKSICDELLACEKCGRNYKIIPQEFKFYKEQGVALPKKCFYCRNEARFKKRNPWKLWDRKCDKCGIDIKTSYDPERPEKVYCEKCYLESLI